MMIDFWFFYYLDKLNHRFGFEARYVWAHRVCCKVCDLAEKYDRDIP